MRNTGCPCLYPEYADLYRISDHGRVYAEARVRYCGRPGSEPQHRPGYLMKPNPVGKDRTHLSVAFSKDGVRRHFKVHHLVLAAFVGPRPSGLEALHWDDDPSNNHLSNLRYGDRSENQHDRVRNGRNSYANQTQCINGHEFTPENTYRPPGRPCKRTCKECVRQHNRDRRRQLRIQGRKVA